MDTSSTRRRFFRTAGGVSLAAVATTAAAPPVSATGLGSQTTDGTIEPGPATDLVQRFCTAWSRLDAAELGAFFTEDATYRNIPIPGVCSGREAIQEALAGQIQVLQYTTLTVQSAVSWQNTVIATRIDSFRYTNSDHDVDLPIVGVFQLTPDFLYFTSWVDYFDLAQSEFETVG
ncbi:nuclear transport factor 2 family protein [Streptomyces pseudovenezuelae]|uniref:Limonene-1,2-epoxide hydrolase n=1 Tax=Streptomyces pseudovenezuelae TaxID=67350 RepID=A0ABT6LIY7_9ACTN|nr:nuclear transport factor 2 family protein [Streptomyces pseudovenezuelae]MDH6216275.1 limonene-1,2-epoxide hydrolase [Streptomyces pseudovenezuelae]